MQEEFKIYFKTYAIAAIIETCHNLCLHIALSIKTKSVYGPDLSLPTSLAMEVIKLLRYKGLLSKRIREKNIKDKEQKFKRQKIAFDFFFLRRSKFTGKQETRREETVGIKLMVTLNKFQL